MPVFPIVSRAHLTGCIVDNQGLGDSDCETLIMTLVTFIVTIFFNECRLYIDHLNLSEELIVSDGKSALVA